jgi:D-alanyl-D-alanine carboxypeptidase
MVFMRLTGKHGKAAVSAVVGFVALALSVSPAQAHRHSRLHVWRPDYVSRPAAPPDTGFGPTAPGASAIMIDAATGNVLAAQGADIPRYPASLTKLMVLDLAFQALRDGRMTLDTEIPVSIHAASVEPVKLGLAPGSAISVRDAILAMTTMSANDAATALGEYLGGGSEDRCAAMMTLRAHALGMAQTTFANASGLPDPAQVTTARDLAILARDIVVNFPEDQGFFEVQRFEFERREWVYSNNGMLKLYPGATGMKTGYTILARHNLITSAVRNGRVLIGVELHEPSWGASYSEMTAMLDGGFGGHVDGDNTMLAQVAAPQMPAAQMPAARPAGAVDPVASERAAPAAPIALAGGARDPNYVLAGWTAQLGVYSRMARARVEAIRVERMRGVGIARIARVERHGRTMWDAQLAGLTLTAAHQTCSALAARRAACVIIAPADDHLAMLDSSGG